MSHSTLPGTGPWSWLEPGLWVYRSRELDLLGQADALLADAAPAARAGGPALLEAKRRLHAAGIGAATAPAAVGGGGHRFVVQVAIQFLAGYRDLNLRDAAHVGHGAVLCHDLEWHGRRELTAVIRGALVGLAATEPAGEPDVAAVSTRAARTAAGWEVSGRKAWVSRVLEAEAFVVFARSPEHLGAFYVPADSPGLKAVPADRPADGEGGDGQGQSGWSWGELLLDRVPVPTTSVLGASVGGIAVFRRHFAEYRPLVAATCLGAAAAAVDRWVELVLAGSESGRGLDDTVAERLGDLRGRVLLALGGLFTGAARPGGIDTSWSKMVKAQAVQTAIDVVRSVEQSMRAESGAALPAGTPPAALAAVRRARRELGAFEEADGAPAPLLRSAGERFVQYSAAILDEISEPTSTMPRPRLSD
jgi:alkylation response protein AidB-like acyl-CoA dehydrogenase